MGTFDDNRRHHAATTSFRASPSTFDPPAGDIGLRRSGRALPVRARTTPPGSSRTATRRYNIQVSGLEQRLRAIGDPKIVIGVSGGLDSTQALIVAAQAMDRSSRPRSDILAFTLPGLRDQRPHTQATPSGSLDALGVTLARASTSPPTARTMLADLGHPFAHGEPVYDVTFENVQAGLRTDYLFRAANQRDGIVLGTGDLSELALGWCTYGVGDQMSHYNVNAGVPKTLIQHLIRWVVASRQFDDDVSATCSMRPRHGDLARARADRRGRGDPEHRGQDRPLRAAGLQPVPHPPPRLPARRIAFLAWHAWHDARAGRGRPASPRTTGAYTIGEIRHWLEVFVQRFFGFSQFKRSAMPNGPKVAAGGSLSPRGDWRAPSDLSAASVACRHPRADPTGRADRIARRRRPRPPFRGHDRPPRS